MIMSCEPFCSRHWQGSHTDKLNPPAEYASLRVVSKWQLENACLRMRSEEETEPDCFLLLSLERNDFMSSHVTVTLLVHLQSQPSEHACECVKERKSPHAFSFASFHFTQTHGIEAAANKHISAFRWPTPQSLPDRFCAAA